MGGGGKGEAVQLQRIVPLVAGLALVAALSGCAAEEQTVAEAAGQSATPRPDETQERALLVALSKIDQRLGDEEWVSEAVSTCREILDDSEARDRNALLRFDDGQGFAITEQQLPALFDAITSTFCF
jgi:hypothetical protein